MKCIIPGRGIRGEILCMLLNCCSCSLPCVNIMTLSALIFFITAFGKAILCLAKIGDELYIEAEPDGVSLSCSNILMTLECSLSLHV